METAGQKLLDDIALHPRGVEEPNPAGNFPGGTRIVRPDGAGAIFDSAGEFQYFGEFQYRP
jgi:hypothetical protein